MTADTHPRGQDITAQIALWRCSLVEHDEIVREEVDELEAHVREAIAERIADGAPESQAVADAIAAVGASWAVAGEYAKADPGRVWRRRVQRMLTGPLAAIAICLPITYLATAVANGTTARFRAAGWSMSVGVGVIAVGVIAALVGVARLSRGRPRWLASSLDDRLARLRDATRRPGNARLVALGAAVVTGLLWGAPLVWQSVGGADTAAPWMHLVLLTFGAALLVGPLVGLTQWTHCARRSRSPVAASDRECVMTWSRRVRWMLLGQVAVMLLGIATALLGALAAGLVWRVRGTFEQMVAAYMAAHVVPWGCAAAFAVSVAQGRPTRTLRAVDRFVAWWRAAPRLRTTALAVAAYIVCGGVLGGLGYGALVAFRVQRYVGFTLAVQVCSAITYGLLPVAITGLLLLTTRAEPTPAREGSVRESTT